MTADIKIEPFLKWAGGKRWLVKSYPAIIPTIRGRYIEPFLGSGAVFFYTNPRRAILGDLNIELIQTYKAIKKDWEKVFNLLQEHHHRHKEKYYYQMRDSYFEDPFKSAARFIYLNRTCWNGLFRVNLSGKFNVPIGTKSSVVFDTDRFDLIAKRLRKARLVAGDFMKLMSESTEGDFVFVDPPYTVRHNHNGFLKYNQKLFSWEDQMRLRDAVVDAASRGAEVLVLNANHESIRKLYRNVGKTRPIERASVLASDSTKRGRVEELAISVGL